MLKSFFGGGAGNGARREDDQVWVTDDARAAGVRNVAERLRRERQSVVVVAPSAAQ